MPRESAASLAVVPVSPQRRPDPPEYLTPEQARLWVQTVDSKPVDWFGKDSAPILVEYVRAIETCDRLEKVVQTTMDAGDPKEIEKVLRVRDREAKRGADLATKLRLTQQSRYTPQAAATASRNHNAAKPWKIAE